MRRLRNLFSLIALSLVTFAVAADEGVINPINVARSVADKKVDRWEGYLWMYVEGDDGSSRYINGNFDMAADGQSISVIRLYDDDTNDWEEIVFDPPIIGFPGAAFGEVDNFGVSLHGYDESGASVMYGHNQSEASGLAPGQPIRIILEPQWERRIISFDPSQYGFGPNELILVTSSGHVAYYDPELGGFVIWVDPSLNTPYVIRDAETGEVIWEGTIDPFFPGEVATGNSTFLLNEYVGGVVKIEYSENSLYLPNQEPYQIEVPGRGLVNGRVYFMNPLEGRSVQWIAAYHDSYPNPNEVIVFRHTNTGEMPTISDGAYYAQVMGEMGAIIIVVITPDDQPFNFGLCFGGDCGKG